MGSKRKWLGCAGLVVLGLGGGWLGARRTEALGSTPVATSWETGIVARRDVGATVLATGVIRPQVGAQVAVGSRASGIVRELRVTVGDRVIAGQLLAELDRVEFVTQVQRAEAVHANAAFERAYAEQEHERTAALAERGVATAVELADARRTADVARAREREASAALEASRVQLSYTRIHAPIDGVVGSVSTQEGETVAASFASPTFVTIIDLSRLEVWAYVDETDIGRVQVGQRATFTVDTYPDDAFTGHVTAIRPTAEIRDNVVNYITLIEFENRPDRLLRPEMTATINIVVDGRTDAVSVPNGALRRDASGTFVLIPAAAGVERRNVTVGFRGSDFTELLAGIEVGERVALGTAACGATASGREGA